MLKWLPRETLKFVSNEIVEFIFVEKKTFIRNLLSKLKKIIVAKQVVFRFVLFKLFVF